MTLTMAWVRAVGDIHELIVASDSRVRAGYSWDIAPKILALPSRDGVIAFAGDTAFAYPLMIQAANTVASYDKSYSRRLGLSETKGHLLRVFNDIIAKMTDPVEGIGFSGVSFLLAGFDWRSQGFRIWEIRFDDEAKAFRSTHGRSLSLWDRRARFHLAGDEIEAATRSLKELVSRRRRTKLDGLDMEPLTVLLEMIDDERFETIGGYPQMMKIYRSLTVVPFAIETSKGRSLGGRPLLDYESPDRVPLMRVTAQDMTVVSHGVSGY